MSFLSFSFIAFLLIAAVLYFIAPKRFQSMVLLSCSIFFYLLFSKRAFVLLLLSALIAFFGARLLERYKEIKWRKCIMILTVGLNLFLLISLKYFSFFTSRYHLIVPLGISFYTLSIIGYVIDVYREKYNAEKNVLDFLLYVSYFPHILQGPIARYDKLGPQLKKYHPFDYERIASGCQLMLWGYMKKMIVADRAAIFVNAVYEQYMTANGTVLFLASLLYTIQIYADFSGCVDIAMGASQIFGIDLAQNFRQPYLAVSINDFWKRWHISLSSWFRDYLYIPLGGNRKGTVRRWVNVLIVFTVSGFWHGVGISYIIWGLLHGFYQVFGAVILPLKQKAVDKLHFDKGDTLGKRVVHMLVTFLLVNFAWIFFRVSDLKQVIIILKTIFTDYAPWVFTDGTLYTFGVSEKAFLLLILFLLLMFVIDVLHERNISIRQKINEKCLAVRWILYLGAAFAVLLFGIYGIGYDAAGFIYMNF